MVWMIPAFLMIMLYGEIFILVGHNTGGTRTRFFTTPLISWVTTVAGFLQSKFASLVVWCPCGVHAFVRRNGKWLVVMKFILISLQNTNIKYSSDIFIVGEFGTHESCQKFKNSDFLNSLIPRKLNSWGIGRIGKMLIVCQFSGLGVPRLPHSYFGAYFVTFVYVLA